MRVILLGDVKALGRKGDVVDVSEGYARNFLLPRKLVKEASAGALAVLGEQRKAQERRDAQALAQARDLAGRIESVRLAVPAKAGSNGKLFGAVTSADVAAAISRAVAAEIDRRSVEIKSQIKALGSYPVEVRLQKGVVAKTTVDVVAS
ncbi:MAG: 50S ribosomal protein L9 [Candidatus Tyrphobacter sp.]